MIRSALLALLLSSYAALPAQTPRSTPRPVPAAPAAEPGTELTISLVTMGRGDEVWELFGHNAIWIHDARFGTDVLYNWGVFDSHQPLFIPHFLQGRMLYRMAGYGLGETLMQYRALNRSVVSQELNLTPAQRVALRAFIAWNERPENLNYRYDYFRDNCSTRVRDALDGVLGGQIQRAAEARMTATTYRWHALRLMQGDKPLMTGVDIALGRPTDHPLTVWQTMFLPEELRRFMTTLQVSDGKGGVVPLVKNERVLFEATRAAEPAQPPRTVFMLGAVGLAVAALLVWIGGIGARGRTRGARLAAAITLGLWCFVAGFLGTLLTLLWTVTDHQAAHDNENLLLFNPLWLLLAFIVPVYFLRGAAAGLTRAIAIVAAILALVAPVLHLALGAQDNLAVIALALPPALAVAWAVTRRPAGVRASR